MADANVVIADVRGTVVANANLNVRQGAPTTAAAIARKVPCGSTLTVTKLVEGQNVSGNSRWFASEGDVFFWSGGVGSPTLEPMTSGALKVARRANGTTRVLQDAEIRTVYGDLQVKEAAGGRVELDPTWIAANIADVPIPLLVAMGIPSISVHQKAKGPFEAVFNEISARGLAGTILTFGGTWVPRHKGWDPSRGLSSHTWGISIDLNVAWNGYGQNPAAIGERGSVRQLVPIFEAAGFGWGGYFEPQSICDGMHFELATLD